MEAYPGGQFLANVAQGGEDSNRTITVAKQASFPCVTGTGHEDFRRNSLSAVTPLANGLGPRDGASRRV